MYKKFINTGLIVTVLGLFILKADSVKAQNMTVENYLIQVHQILDLWINSTEGAMRMGDSTYYKAITPGYCMGTIQFRYGLQQLIINRRISPRSRSFINAGRKITYLRRIAGCDEV